MEHLAEALTRALKELQGRLVTELIKPSDGERTNFLRGQLRGLQDAVDVVRETEREIEEREASDE